MDDAQKMAQGGALPGYPYPNLGGGISQGQPRAPKTFDSIASAVDRVNQYRAQVSRMLDRITPRETDKIALGDCANAINAARPTYTISLERLQDALGNLGKSLDELEAHI